MPDKEKYKRDVLVTSLHGGGFWDVLDYDPARVGELGTTIIPADVLDAWYPPSPKVVTATQESLEKMIHTCPPAQPIGLVRTLAKTRGLQEKNILGGTGSSQLIFLLLQHILQKEDIVVLPDPLYGEYRFVAEQIVGARVIPYFLNPEHGFAISIPEFASEITKHRPKAVILVNPNSPTGSFITKRQIEELLQTIPASTTVLLDETYIEYVGSEDSCEKLAAGNPKLCILKSMSKIYALSGLRVGYLVASESLIRKLQPNIPPWSVSLLAQMAAIEALNDWGYYQQRVVETKNLANELFEKLTQIPFLEPFPTVTNFILCRVKGIKASELVSRLEKEKIFLRNTDSMSEQFHDDFIRITIMDRLTNEKIVSGLRRHVR